MNGARHDENDDALSVGEVLCEKWRIVRLIGRGGMSAVYEAKDQAGAAVAIKVLNTIFARQSRARERFLREGLVANRVGHPDTVHVFESQQTPEGRLLLVMELLQGRTLRKRCEEAGGRLELAEVLSLAERMLEVLAAAHSKGIFHRDIKPENIFLTSDHGVKVLDFGVAAVRDEASQDASITQSGTTLGTPAFMAPEQARGRQAQVDGRTDIWALGATLFFCLAGRRVHEGAVTANEALIFAATQRAPTVSRFCPELASDVGPVIDRALAFAPEERWPSAEAMREALAQAAARRHAAATVAGLPDDTLASTLSDRSEQANRWLRWPVLLGAGTIALAGVISAVRSQQRPHADQPLVESPARAAAPAALAPPAKPADELLAPPTTALPAPSALPPIARTARPAPPAGASIPRPRKSAKVSTADDVPEVLLDQRK